MYWLDCHEVGYWLVIVDVVRAETPRTRAILLSGGQWAGRDDHRVGFVPQVDNPGQLRMVAAVFGHRLVSHDQQIAIEERKHGVSEARERRVVVEPAQRLGRGEVRDVEDHDARIEIAEVGAVRPLRVDIAVV